MEIKKIDYNNFDRLDVYAKVDKIDGIIKCYESFSWELYKREENDTYADTENLTFIRPHKIKQKDKLQYAQIEMENMLNEIGKSERKKHSKSTVVGLCMGLTSAILIAISVYLVTVLSVVGLVHIIVGWVVSAVVVTSTAIATTKVFKKERVDFEKQQALLHKNLENICQDIRRKYGKENKE